MSISCYKDYQLIIQPGGCNPLGAAFDYHDALLELSGNSISWVQSTNKLWATLEGFGNSSGVDPTLIATLDYSGGTPPVMVKFANDPYSGFGFQGEPYYGLFYHQPHDCIIHVCTYHNPVPNPYTPGAVPFDVIRFYQPDGTMINEVDPNWNDTHGNSAWYKSFCRTSNANHVVCANLVGIGTSDVILLDTLAHSIVLHAPVVDHFDTSGSLWGRICYVNSTNKVLIPTGGICALQEFNPLTLVRTNYINNALGVGLYVESVTHDSLRDKLWLNSQGFPNAQFFRMNSATYAVEASYTFYSTSSDAVISAGGAGYTMGDILTVVGGVGLAAAFRVSGLGGGNSVTAATILEPGAYTTVPITPADTTGGTGVGCKISFAPGEPYSSFAYDTYYDSRCDCLVLNAGGFLYIMNPQTYDVEKGYFADGFNFFGMTDVDTTSGAIFAGAFWTVANSGVWRVAR